MPVRVAVVEGAADVHGIDAQPVEQLVRGLRELLDDVVDPGPLVSQPQVPHEVGVRDRGDAGAGRGAQVHRQAVRLAVLDRGQDPLTGTHGRAGGHEAYSAGSASGYRPYSRTSLTMRSYVGPETSLETEWSDMKM